MPRATLVVGGRIEAMLKYTLSRFSVVRGGKIVFPCMMMCGGRPAKGRRSFSGLLEPRLERAAEGTLCCVDAKNPAEQDPGAGNG